MCDERRATNGRRKVPRWLLVVFVLVVLMIVWWLSIPDIPPPPPRPTWTPTATATATHTPTLTVTPLLTPSKTLTPTSRPMYTSTPTLCTGITAEGSSYYLYDLPDEDSEKIGVIEPANWVSVLDQTRDDDGDFWYKIRRDMGDIEIIAWIPGKYVVIDGSCPRIP